MEEIWKDIPEYENEYMVSNYGRIKSLKFGKENILIPSYTRNKYPQIRLCKNGNWKQFLVHILVWSAFNGTIPEGYEINHIDESPQNCMLSNLNLLTHKQNVNWGTRNERAGKKLKNRKDVSKKVLQYDLEGNLIKEWPSAMEIKRALGYSNASICNCCLNSKHYHTAYGYIWKYAV